MLKIYLLSVRNQELCSIMNEQATALLLASANEVIVGCVSGNVYGLTPSSTAPTPFFRNHPVHDIVVGMTYKKDTNVLVVGYREGIVHVKKCTMFLAADNPWRMYCEHIATPGSLESVLSLCPEKDVMEVWLGCSGARVEVWIIQGKDLLVPGKMEKEVVTIQLPSNERRGVLVVGMKPTPDNTMVIALLEVLNSLQCVFISLDAKSKAFVGSWTLPYQGQSCTSRD